ncbi:MAG: DUF3426 domain-containing protein [Gammaproteobacteria bacterium]
MYTNCPECGTVFRVSSPDLRVAEGYVRCGHCSATFNALATLADEPPATPNPEPNPSPRPCFPLAPESPAQPPGLRAAATYVPLPVSEDTLEFDIPEGSWSNFFGTNPAAEGEPEVEPESEPQPDEPPAVRPEVGTGIGSATVDQAGLYRALSAEAEDLGVDDNSDWQALLEEVPDDDATPDSVYVIGEEASQRPMEAPELPGPAWDEPRPGEAWAPAPLPPDFAADLPGETDSEGTRPEPATPGAGGPLSADRPFIWQSPAPPTTARSRGHWAYTAGSVLLALLLIIQVLHQQRDDLATNPTLTEALQRTYAALGLPLWPAWDLRSYELRKTEAVADPAGALDILARIAVVGNERVGLPLVRVTLRDRFSKPLGTRVFQPAEYLGENPRPREPVSPGTLIPVKISLRDPGTSAQGFDVDVCVMSRREGIICRAERDPFAR